jgi:hypothetical protein
MLSKINSLLTGILVALCIIYCSNAFYYIYKQNEKVSKQEEIMVAKSFFYPNFINLWRISK